MTGVEGGGIGLEVGEGGGLGGVGVGGVGLGWWGLGWWLRGLGVGFGEVAVEVFEEAGDEGGGGGGGGWEEFGAGGEGAVGGVDGDLLDDASLLLWLAGLAGLGEVEGGDLEAVEEEAGAAGVELVGGEAVEDLADGLLDGGAVFGDGEGEGGGLVLALGEVEGGDGAAGVGLAVVEAEVLAGEAGAAAAVAVGEDVAALVAARVDGDGGVWHGVGTPPPGT